MSAPAGTALVPSIDELEFAALSWPERATALAVSDLDTYRLAGELLTGIKTLRAEIAETCDPVIRSAHATHKAACAQKATLEAPLVEAEATIKKRMTAWRDEDERQRLAEQRRLAEIARKADEDARMAEAVALEQAGEPELAHAVIAAPSIVAAPVIAAPKVDGIAVRKLWRAEVVDLKALCAGVANGTVPVNLVVANTSALNQMATALKESFTVAGCRVVCETSIAGGRR